MQCPTEEDETVKSDLSRSESSQVRSDRDSSTGGKENAITPELDIELVQTVDLRSHQVIKVTSKGMKEMIEAESEMAKPNKAQLAAAGTVKVGSKEDVQKSLSPTKPINLFKRKKSPQTKDNAGGLIPVLEEHKRKEKRVGDGANMFETYEEKQMKIEKRVKRQLGEMDANISIDEGVKCMPVSVSPQKSSRRHLETESNCDEEEEEQERKQQRSSRYSAGQRASSTTDSNQQRKGAINLFKKKR